MSSHEVGSHPLFPQSLVVQVKALAGELPHRLGLPLSRLSLAEIRQHAITQGLVAESSGATLWRWLSSDALRPWQHRGFFGEHLTARALRIGVPAASISAGKSQVLRLVAYSREAKDLRSVTSNPTAEWIAGQVTDAFPWDEAPRHMIRDRDGAFGPAYTGRIRAMGIRDRLPHHARRGSRTGTLNGSLDRFVANLSTTSSCSANRTCAVS